jgi:DNA-binding MarR family transcriptional regulator
VLYIVQAAPSVRMSDLAARLGVALSTVSGVIDRLVDQGLLSREDDPADRRHVLLHITPAGTTQLERFRELNAGHFRTILARVGDADLGMVERALAALAAAAGPGEPVTPHPSPAPGSSRLTPTTSTTGGSSS